MHRILIWGPLALMVMVFAIMSGGAVGGSAVATQPCAATAPPAKAGAYTVAELSRLWVAAGGPQNVADVAGAIAFAESTGNPRIVNEIGAAGLWQIYGLPFPGDPLDPMTNARMAVRKWEDAPGGGHNFTPWTAYTGADTPHHEKTYLRYMPNARTHDRLPIVECGAPVDLSKIMGPFHIVAIPWQPGEEIAAEILPVATRLHTIYGVAVSDAYDRDRSANHKSPGHNVTGTAVDFTGTPAQTDDVARWAVAHQLTVYYDGSLGTTPLEGHGPGNHIHVEFASLP